MSIAAPPRRLSPMTPRNASESAPRRSLGYRKNISVVLLCFFLSLLFRFRFLDAHFRGTLLECGLGEKTFGKTRIVFAGLKENLVDAAAITIERDLQRGPHAVH